MTATVREARLAAHVAFADYRQGREWRRTCGCAATADVREDAVLKCLCCECGAPLVSVRGK